MFGRTLKNSSSLPDRQVLSPMLDVSSSNVFFFASFKICTSSLQCAGIFASATESHVCTQNLFLVGSGDGLRVTLLSSRPLSFNHFFVLNSNSRSSSGEGSFL